MTANTDLPLTPIAIPFAATEQTTFFGRVATFTDADPEGGQADFTATIDWGDGSISAATIVADSTIVGQFDVIGSHGYLIAGSYTVVVKIADVGGAAAMVASTALVADAALAAAGRPFEAQEGTNFSGNVASFADANPFSAAADFTATIAWGDGHTSLGTVVADPIVPGLFMVSGTNSYMEEGVFEVAVTIADQAAPARGSIGGRRFRRTAVGGRPCSGGRPRRRVHGNCRYFLRRQFRRFARRFHRHD